MFGIINKLGGEQPVLDVIHRRRKLTKHLTHRAVVEWVWARKVPAINIYHLTEECRERGIPVDADDFCLPKVLPRKGDKSFPRKSGQGSAVT